MKCREVLEVLDEFVSDECPQAVADSIGSHVAVCPQCAAELDQAVSERRIYARFLLDAEPAADFGQRFFARLDADLVSAPPPPSARNGFFSLLFFSLRPVLGVAAVIIVGLMAAFVYLSERPAGLPITVAPPVENPPPIAPTVVPDNEPGTIPARIEPETRSEDRENQPQTEHAVLRSRSPKRVVRPNNASASGRGDFRAPVDERTSALRGFAADTNRQIENVEQLLRSFRNARSADADGGFDIAYERELAARLLSRNIDLRRRALILRDPVAAEVLDRVEPYLVEISNLDDAPSDEVVLAIKQRVRNQNVIASIQGF